MTAAIYEMLCQAYAYVNSLGYRKPHGDSGRTREIHTLTLTYPSGMIQEEKERFRQAVPEGDQHLRRTLGKNQRVKPELTLSIDEASAVHLTYIWSELRMLGQDPRLWFATLGRDHSQRQGRGADEAEDDAGGGGRRRRARRATSRRRRGRSRPARRRARCRQAEEPDERYEAQRNAHRLHRHRRRHHRPDDRQLQLRAGDRRLDPRPGAAPGRHLARRRPTGQAAAGTIIVPQFADAIGLEDEDVQLLFGPRVPKNRGFSSQRINWINRLFVPLAQAYLHTAVDEVDQRPTKATFEISHTDPEVVDPAVLESLEQVCNKLRGPGYYNVQQELDLAFDKASSKAWSTTCSTSCCSTTASGSSNTRPTSCCWPASPRSSATSRNWCGCTCRCPVADRAHVQPLRRQLVSLPGREGPQPGVIVDPKSPVVVGRGHRVHGPQRHAAPVQVRDAGQGHGEHLLLGRDDRRDLDDPQGTDPVPPGRGREHQGRMTEFTTIAQRVVIGRKMTGDEDAQATPIYVLKMDTGDRIGPTEVTVRIRRVAGRRRRRRTSGSRSVTGTVAGEPPSWTKTSSSPGGPWPTNATTSTPAAWTTSSKSEITSC